MNKPSTAIKVVVTGASGQLGQCLQDELMDDFPLAVSFLGRREIDFSDFDASLARNPRTKSLCQQADYLINCAAYTAVDQAESEPDLARRVNVDAIQHLKSISGTNTRLVQISTDFVFDGRSRSPYEPRSETNPLSVYGQTKRQAEIAAFDIWRQNAMIIRTSWLYSEHGGNFVKTMLRLMSERDEVSVVQDQTGSPTYAAGLARTLWALLVQNSFTPGIFHWSDRGEISWFEFAQQIYEQAQRRSVLSKPVKINAIPSSEYPTPAERPSYSVMNCVDLESLCGIACEPWGLQLAKMLNRHWQRN